MFEFKFCIAMRNILFIQMLMIAMLPGLALQVHRELAEIWKTLKTPILPKKADSRKKGCSFWEIDMTKFDP